MVMTDGSAMEAFVSPILRREVFKIVQSNLGRLLWDLDNSHLEQRAPAMFFPVQLCWKQEKHVPRVVEGH